MARQVRLVPTGDVLVGGLIEAATCASHLGSCNVDCLFEDFHSIAFANQKRRIVAAKLLAITELGLPFSGIENHATFQA
jgi:hypothetical protein